MFLLFLPLLLLYVVGGLFVVCWGARWAGRRFQSRFAYGGAFILIFAAVFGDEIYGYAYWQHLCSTQGGQHVYKRVPVEGFREAGKTNDGIAEEFLRKGYAYVESGHYRDHGEKRGQLYRYTLGNGHVVRTPISDSQSRYIRSENIAVPYPHYIWAYEIYIKDQSTGELLSVNRSFGYKGATIVRALRAITGANFEGSASYCGEFSGNQLIDTIPPLNQKVKGASHE